jgi:hypothetical protein
MASTLARVCHIQTPSSLQEHEYDSKGNIVASIKAGTPVLRLSEPHAA